MWPLKGTRALSIRTAKQKLGTLRQSEAPDPAFTHRPCDLAEQRIVEGYYRLQPCRPSAPLWALVMGSAGEVQVDKQQIAGQLAVCFASGRVDAATAAGLAHLFPGAALLSMSILAGGQLLITADNVAKEGFFKISFLRLTESAAGEAVRTNVTCNAGRPHASPSCYYDVEHAYDASGVTTLCCAPIPHSSALPAPGSPVRGAKALSSTSAAMGALSLGFTPNTHISNSHLSNLAELAQLISPFLVRYACTMIKDLTSVFFQPTLARCLCGCTCGKCEDGADCNGSDNDMDQGGCAEDMEFWSDEDLDGFGIRIPVENEEELLGLEGSTAGAAGTSCSDCGAVPDSPMRVGSFPVSLADVGRDGEGSRLGSLEQAVRRSVELDPSVQSINGSDGVDSDGAYEVADNLLAAAAGALGGGPSSSSAGTARLTDAQLMQQGGGKAGRPTSRRTSLEDTHLECCFQKWQASQQFKVDAIFGLVFTGVWLLLSFLEPYNLAHRIGRGEWLLGTGALMTPLALMAFSLHTYLQHREKLLLALNIFFAVFFRQVVLPALLTMIPPGKIATLPWLIKLSGAEELICHSLGGMVRFSVYLPMQLVCVGVVASALPEVCGTADLPRGCLPLMWAMAMAVGYALPAGVIYHQEKRARRIFLNSSSGGGSSVKA
ncbi:hypothetical protein WJX72_005377 [[Myrmecia] bisecta]|uniref:Uncharacterized protein n=1 Tax=[Myrmecia] bisecta TaxID=41462 RepID=A0AAW1R750_9CHLO